MLDLDLDNIDTTETETVAAPVAAAATGARRGRKPSVAAAASTAAPAAEGGKKRQVLSNLLGRQARQSSNLDREITVHNRIPQDVVRHRFNQFVNARGDNMSKQQTNAIFNIVEEFLSTEIFPLYAVKFAGINFKHASRSGRINPNPQNTEVFTYSPGHLQVQGTMALTDNTTIAGRVTADKQFEAGAEVDGEFVVDQEAMARIAECQAVVDEFRKQRAMSSPLARKALAEANATAEASVEGADSDVVLDEDVLDPVGDDEVAE